MSRRTNLSWNITASFCAWYFLPLIITFILLAHLSTQNRQNKHHGRVIFKSEEECFSHNVTSQLLFLCNHYALCNMHSVASWDCAGMLLTFWYSCRATVFSPLQPLVGSCSDSLCLYMSISNDSIRTCWEKPCKNHLDCRSSLSNRILRITLTRSNFSATKSPEGKLLGNKGSMWFCFSSCCCWCSCKSGHRVPVTPLGHTNRLISICMHTRVCLCLYWKHGHVMLTEVAPVRAGLSSKERPCRFSP